MVSIVQFTEAFDGWQFPYSTVTEGQFIAHAREIADDVFPEWNHEAPGDVGWFALALYLKALTQGIHLANAWAQESNIFTAREEKMILARARALGYAPKSATPAKVDLLVTLPSAPSVRTFDQYSLKITNRDAVGEENEVFFENEQAFSVGANVTQVSVSMVAGRSFTQLATSDGSSFQSVVLNEMPVLDGYTRVEVLSLLWALVDTLAYSKPTNKHFTASLRDDGKTVLGFGNGVNGQIPPSGQAITIQYRTGGGDETNVPLDTLRYVFETPHAITEVTNPLRARGGEPKETKASIVRSAPLTYRTRSFLGRLEEIDAFSEAFTGVARAKSLVVGSQITVGIIPSGGGVANSSLKSTLQTALNQQIGLGYSAVVDDPAFVAPTIDVLFTTKEGFISAQIEAAIVADLQALLNPLTTTVDKETQEILFLRQAGQTLFLNEIRGVLDARPEIEKDFVIRAPSADVPVPANAFVTGEGASLTATSRNTQTVGYIP